MFFYQGTETTEREKLKIISTRIKANKLSADNIQISTKE